jgi:hypothetical protein
MSYTTPGWIAFPPDNPATRSHVPEWRHFDDSNATVLCKACGEMFECYGWARKPCPGTRKVEDDGQHTT